MLCVDPPFLRAALSVLGCMVSLEHECGVCVALRRAYLCDAQPRGQRKHLKRLSAPKHWMLDKLTGTWVRFVCACARM
jgi:hypothetical protein